MLTSASYGQQLSTAAYPSEDELYEALLRNEITYEEFNELRDLLERGVDSLSLHLWDVIPNLNSFVNKPVSKRTLLVQEQAASFKSTETSLRKLKYRHTYQTQLEDEPDFRYTSELSVHISKQWEGSITVKRDYSGRERLMRRYLSYRRKTGLLRQMIIGNYSRRLGLGSVVGYRGKLLDYSDKLNGETLLFPDYGGSNGLFLKMAAGKYSLDIVSSMQRDTDYNISLAAIQFTRHFRAVDLYLVGAHNRVKGKSVSTPYSKSFLSAGSKYNYAKGKFWLESTWQLNNRIDPVAFIMEGRHILKNAEILFAAWVYGDNYSDLTGDSKYGNLSRRTTLDEIGLRYSNKRTGIEGGMFKTVLEPISGWQIVTSAVVASLNGDTTNSQLLTALVKKFSRQWQIRIDHLNETRHRADVNVNVDAVDRRTRFETKYSSGKSFVRTYIAYLTTSGKEDRLALFVRWYARTAQLGQIDIWSNLARLNAKEGMINYWYIYLNSLQDISDSMSAGFKVSHRYNRRTSDKHLTTVTLQLRVTL